MGKNLKGRECGKGICQRKDGKYAARYTSKNGSRKEKHFDTLPEARNWLADVQYEEKHDVHSTSSEMAVDSWFEFWITNLIADLAPNTKRNYRERYRVNIQPVIGSMRLCDVKPMHCKIILNRMEATYAGSTIRQAYITMGTMFRAAVMNDMLTKHPMNGVRYTKPVRAVDDIKFLTVDEQVKFLEVAKRSHNYRQYVLLLETGLRTSEMIGLTWDAIDWKKRTLTVSKTLEYRHGVFALAINAVVIQNFHTGSGGAGSVAQIQALEYTGIGHMGHAVHVLLGIQPVADLVLVGLQVLGQGPEHQHAVDALVGIDLVDCSQDLLLGGVLRQLKLLNFNAHQLGALQCALFIAQIAGVCAHADNAQGRDNALFPQGSGTGLQICIQGIGNFLAQQQLCHNYNSSNYVFLILIIDRTAP